VFAAVSSQRLRQMAEELGRLGDQEPDTGAENATRFAKCLSVLMRCEVARRLSQFQEADEEMSRRILMQSEDE
jgi:hypothetical protein